MSACPIVTARHVFWAIGTHVPLVHTCFSAVGAAVPCSQQIDRWGLEWSRVRDALWLRPPRDPKTGRVGGRVWWWVIPFMLIFGLEQFVPAIPGPSTRAFGELLSSDRGEEFFRGAWGWFAVIVVLAMFNTVLGEELPFRAPR
jgi:hypothetical protein